MLTITTHIVYPKPKPPEKLSKNDPKYHKKLREQAFENGKCQRCKKRAFKPGRKTCEHCIDQESRRKELKRVESRGIPKQAKEAKVSAGKGRGHVQRMDGVGDST